MLKVGINGFGRIGRAVFRINLKKNAFSLVCINDINPDKSNISYLAKYDSSYGKLEHDIKATEKGFVVDGEEIQVHHEKNIDDVPWEKYGVDIVIDASGIAHNLERCKHLKKQGVKRVICTNSPDDVDRTVVLGVNENEIQDDDYVLSSSICDANAFAPVMKVLDDEYGIDHGFVTTLHPWLQYQNLLDGPSQSYSVPGKIHTHYVLGRASPGNLIPKHTSCVSASEKVLPSLHGKFMSLSYRVPTMVVSSADVTVKLKKGVTEDEIITLFTEKEQKQQWNVFSNTLEPLTSIDFQGSEYSANIDHRWTMVNGENYVKLILWYDNEWGYSCRVVDLVRYLSRKGEKPHKDSVFDTAASRDEGKIIKTITLHPKIIPHTEKIKRFIQTYISQILDAGIPIPPIRNMFLKDERLLCETDDKGKNLLEIHTPETLIDTPEFSEMLSLVKKAQEKGVHLDPHPKNFVVESGEMHFVDFCPPLIEEHISLRLSTDTSGERILKAYFEGFNPEVLGYHIAADLGKLGASLEKMFPLLLQAGLIEDDKEKYKRILAHIQKEEQQMHASGLRPI